MRSVFKFPVILTLTLIFQVSQAQYCGNSGSFQCTPVSVSPNPGFYPPVDSFPVFVNNYISTAAFQFRNFDTIVFGNELLNVHALTFDTIDNLPPGLCWATDQPSNTYGNSQNGCITINGTPCGATGQYKLRVIVTVDIGIPVQTDGGPGGLIYFMRLINNGDPVFPVDQTQTDSIPLIAYGGNCFPIVPLVLSLDSAVTVCNGGIVTLKPTISGGAPPYSFSWQSLGSNLSCSNCQNPVTTITQTTLIGLTVTDANNTTATASATYSVAGFPINCNITPSGSTTFCHSGSSVLSAVSDTGINYQWIKDGSIIAGAINNTYTANDSSGNYWLLFTEPGVCEAQSNIIQLTFFDTPPANINTLGSSNLCQGNIVIIEADTFAGTGDILYQWRQNGIDDTFYSPVYFATNAGSYDVIITNSANCSDTSNVIVVNTNSNFPPIVSLSGYPDTVCYNGLPIALTGDDPPGGNFSGSAVWGNVFYPDSAFIGSNPVTYTYTDSNGCSNWATDSIIIVFCVTGINDLSLENSISIYPNPANDMLTIESAELTKDHYRFNIYDMAGKEIELPHSSQAGKITLNTSTISSGIYLLQFNINGQMLNKKFVKL